MRALILAGGLGTRLRPLTYTRPKHLLPIANRPHIDHVLSLLHRHDVTEAVLLTSYLAEAFEPTIARARERGFTMEVTYEDEPMGTAGALRFAEDRVGAGTFLVFNGDILTNVDLSALIQFHRDRGAAATIFLLPVEDPSRFGVVPTADDGKVTGFIEKPAPGTAPTNLINAGVYVMEPSVLEFIPKGEVWSAERQLFPELVAKDAGLYATDLAAYWIDIGTPESLLRANMDAVEGRYQTEAVTDPAPGGVLIGEGAKVDGDAVVRMAAIGAGTTVGPGAAVERSVLLPNVTVGEGAEVRDSILGEGVVVAPGSSVAGATVGDNEKV